MVFERPDIALTYGFLGALVGSLSRPLGGRLSDRLGGSLVTIVALRRHGRGGVVAVVGVQQKCLPIFFASFMALFVATGVGNGSTYRMIPAIFTRLAARDGSEGSALEYRRRAAGAVGIISAVGAFGGFVIPFVYKFAREEYGSIVPALQVYVRVFLGLAGSPGPSTCAAAPRWPRSEATVPSTSTHCPYCALQCAQTLHATPVPRHRFASRRGTSPPTGAACARRAGLGRGAHRCRPAHHPAGARSGRREGPLEPATWDEALDLVRSSAASAQADHGRTPWRCSAAAG